MALEAITKTVAVVDDDEDVRNSTAALLIAAGYHPRLYGDGKSFLDHAIVNPSVVLLDVRMPKMDGIAVLRALHDREHIPPILVLTGHGDIDVAVRAMKLGAHDFMLKPYHPEDLLRRIGEAVELNVQSRSLGLVNASAVDSIDRLTTRQRDILRRVAKGLPNKVIAFELGLSVRTVEGYRAQLLERLEVRSTAEAIRLAVLAGLHC